MTASMGIATGLVTVILLVQPSVRLRAAVVIGVINTVGVLLLALNRRGQTTVAARLLVGYLVTQATLLSLLAGGIRSPGITMFFVFVLMAGLLLGQRAGVITAIVCAGIGLGLVVLDAQGFLPPDSANYRPISLWILNGLYMSVVLVLLRLATSEMATSLVERERLVTTLRERVKELQLLHQATALLQRDRPFDRAVLQQLVALIPAGWQHPDICRARIVYRGLDEATPDWRDTPWCMTAPFETSRGSGRIDVVYIAERPAAVEGPFLAEERQLIDSLADLLAAYLEHDFAEQQRQGLERQLRHAQKMEALGTLSGGIAHDFNNILTAIGGNAELARADLPLDHPVRPFMGEVLSAHERARDLVKRILLFSRRQDSERKVMSVVPVVEEAVKLLRVSLPPMIEIRCHYAEDLPRVFADSTQIHQIVMNLGTNAGYAMGARSGVLSITLDRVTIGEAAASPSADLMPGPHVCLTVSDSGTGMSPEILSRLFEPFFTTKGNRGTGLGLSVVHGIVRDHQGAITVESTLGRGSTFRVYLPASTRAEISEPGHSTAITPGTGQHIMYVDDEETIVFLMTRMLTRLGYRCTGYSNAAAALQAFRTNPGDFDAIVSDMAMPSMTGVELARAIHDIRADVPIALASGYGPDDEAIAAAGIAVGIQKPISLDLLGHKIDALLRRAT